MMQFVPSELTGKYVRVVPYSEQYADALAITGNLHMMYYTFGPLEWTREGIFAYIENRYTGKDNRVPYVIISQATDDVVGFAAFINIERDHRRLEIGPVWIAEAHQGSAAFSEAMYLMLKQAFEVEAAQRVEFTCDSRNIRSRSALLKIGATIEGTIRKDVFRPDKSIRDTIIMGIIDTDWSRVAHDLQLRLYPVQVAHSSSKTIHLRQSRLEDVVGIWEVEKSAFGQGYSQSIIRQYYDLFSDLLYVAETDSSQIVGYVLAGAVSKDANVAWILTLAVKRDYQKQGIGTLLMAAIHEQLHVRECTVVLLTVHPDKAKIIAFYEKLGYVKQSFIPDYFGPNSPRHVMQLDLIHAKV